MPFGPVMNVDEIAHDPHFAARGMLAEIECEGIPGPMRIAGQPIKFTRTPAGVRRRAPDLGEDTAAVLRRARRISDEEIERWRAVRRDQGGKLHDRASDAPQRAPSSRCPASARR